MVAVAPGTTLSWRPYCLAEPGAVRDTPWGDGPVAKVGGKIVAYLDGAGVGMTCGRDADEAGELGLRFPEAVTVVRHLGRYGWNTIALDRPPAQIPDDGELITPAAPRWWRLPQRLRPA